MSFSHVKCELFSKMNREFLERITAILGAAPKRLESLSGGLGTVYRVAMPDGTSVVAKIGKSLEIEAYMLNYLAEHSTLPVPHPIHATETLLVMEYIESDNSFDQSTEHHAAELLAQLHGITSPTFGLERDTVIGTLPQPNPPTDDWLSFFREHRLLYMANTATRSGRLTTPVLARIERLAGQLDRWLFEPPAPALLHGDIWSGNVLTQNGHISGLIDPAIYYGHPEIELAFITLFNTFGDSFFTHYQEVRPIADDFFEERRDLYNLYPLLVHVAIFGGSYVQSVERTLRRFGI
jgi:fructosamine-3-kinase